jgi:hypothetical protein
VVFVVGHQRPSSSPAPTHNLLPPHCMVSLCCPSSGGMQPNSGCKSQHLPGLESLLLCFIDVLLAGLCFCLGWGP